MLLFLLAGCPEPVVLPDWAVAVRLELIAMKDRGVKDRVPMHIELPLGDPDPAAFDTHEFTAYSEMVQVAGAAAEDALFPAGAPRPDDYSPYSTIPFVAMSVTPEDGIAMIDALTEGSLVTIANLTVDPPDGRFNQSTSMPCDAADPSTTSGYPTANLQALNQKATQTPSRAVLVLIDSGFNYDPSGGKYDYGGQFLMNGAAVASACYTNKQCVCAASLTASTCYSPGVTSGSTFAAGCGTSDAAACNHGSEVASLLGSPTIAYPTTAPTSPIPTYVSDLQTLPIRVGYVAGGEVNVRYRDVAAALDLVASTLKPAYPAIAAVSITATFKRTSGSSTASAKGCESSWSEFRPLARVVSAVDASGVAVVVASGNEDSANGLPAMGCLSKTIVAGGVSAAGGSCCVWTKRSTAAIVGSYGSNDDDFVDIHAPASGLTVLNGQYGLGYTPAFQGRSGTSLAAPQVAAAIALARDVTPTMTVAQARTKLADWASATSCVDNRTGAAAPQRGLDASKW